MGFRHILFSIPLNTVLFTILLSFVFPHIGFYPDWKYLILIFSTGQAVTTLLAFALFWGSSSSRRQPA